MELVRIPAENVNDAWPLCREFIESAATDQEPDDLRLLCSNGMGQLWFAWSGELHAAAVTRIDPDGACCLLACGGKDMSRWLWMLDEIELWAKANKCNRMMLAGRKGWIRKLKDYTISRVFLEKRL